MNDLTYEQILQAEAHKAGVGTITYHKGNYGCAYQKTKNIFVPEPKTLYTLATALHEVAHISIGKVKPQYYAEYLCEMWVREKFKEHGLVLKRRIADSQKRYVAHRVMLSYKRSSSPEYRVKKEVLDFIGAHQEGVLSSGGLENDRIILCTL